MDEHKRAGNGGEPDRLRVLLQKHFGFSDFRPGQREVIEAVCGGEDVLAIMPTGQGKSLCYQVPAHVIGGLTLVVSPLLALIEDQVYSLRKSGEKRVRALTGNVHSNERTRVLEQLSTLRFLLLSPEMLRREAVIAALARVKVNLFVVDEAHCVSQWGHEFRPDYLHLLEVRQQIGLPACLALTATARPRVRKDIIRYLGLERARVFCSSADRPNIAVCARTVAGNHEKVERLLVLLSRVKLPAIVYCASRQWCERLTVLIGSRLPFRAAFYHGGMTGEDRLRIQNQFLQGELDILCCTNAFGMGIDMAHVRLVVHFHLPASLDAYLQEIGRAGRDGAGALAVLYYASGDEQLQRVLIASNYPEDVLLQYVLFELDRGMLSLENEESFVARLSEHGAGETAIRFLLEQLRDNFSADTYTERLGSLRLVIAERLQQKTTELDEMLHWIDAPGCRREAYLRSYHEMLRQRPQPCCDRCGMDWAAFFAPTRPATVSATLDWRRRLDHLFISRS
ncbi:MAG: RecQ family ATP-dependent DNA helicase [Sporolactobacillus sp.]